MINSVSSILPYPLSPFGISEPVPGATSRSLFVPTTSTNAADPLHGLNLDLWNLSPVDGKQVQLARFQYDLAYQVINSMYATIGQTASTKDFYRQASSDAVQQISRIRSITPLTLDASRATTSLFRRNWSENVTSSTLDGFLSFQDYFSPEKTAQRILDVATSSFGADGTGEGPGSTVASRQVFADYIGKAIETGFTQAAIRMGTLPEAVQNGIDLTHSLVNSGLEEFVATGAKVGKADSGSIMGKIAAYRQESARFFDRLKKAFAPSDYDVHGFLQKIWMGSFLQTA